MKNKKNPPPPPNIIFIMQCSPTRESPHSLSITTELLILFGGVLTLSLLLRNPSVDDAQTWPKGMLTGDPGSHPSEQPVTCSSQGDPPGALENPQQTETVSLKGHKAAGHTGWRLCSSPATQGQQNKVHCSHESECIFLLHFLLFLLYKSYFCLCS